ncbi:TIR domain-containing protein [uncultured Roseivirga sp.]|uniref:TIR domain-containing protein n=1 Tax=uncultured Roseivirga sp. TaxID=543088 RepID=UPI0030DDB99D|tara:strand:- start:80198 stop:80599 length:402 start_codon:yes stop_codon:yes gene_type:complete
MAKTYTIFISHSWAYIDDLNSLKRLLENKGYFNVQFEEATPDVPINSDNAYYIRQRLKQKISNSDVVLGIAGIYASHSEWMVWELDKALGLGKPIIGVVPRGAERVSTVISSRANEVVRWNTDSIVEAIRKWA